MGTLGALQAAWEAVLGAAGVTSPLHRTHLPLGLESENQVCLSMCSRSFLTC